MFIALARSRMAIASACCWAAPSNFAWSASRYWPPSRPRRRGIRAARRRLEPGADGAAARRHSGACGGPWYSWPGPRQRNMPGTPASANARFFSIRQHYRTSVQNYFDKPFPCATSPRRREHAGVEQQRVQHRGIDRADRQLADRRVQGGRATLAAVRLRQLDKPNIFATRPENAKDEQRVHAVDEEGLAPARRRFAHGACGLTSSSQ
jgi:hypothetical protein